jgi:hypothetical protein
MNHFRAIQVGLLMLSGLLLAPGGVAGMPAGASSVTKPARPGASTSVPANMYVTLGTLQPLFQDRINQQVPGAVANAINNIVGKLPGRDQGWASHMAATLIQPAATLTSLKTQRDGLAASLRLSLYPGDPQAISARALITFSVINPSTIAVNGQPINGDPALLRGPLTTFQISIGQLNSIATTPTCGDASLALGLQFPVTLGQGQANTSTSAANIPVAMRPQAPRGAGDIERAPGSSSYIELPARSLASIGASFVALPISGGLTARNIAIGVRGGNLLIISDIYAPLFGKIGTATSTVAPTTARGSLAVHVLTTSLTILNIFTFPYNSYNQQIQQIFNSRLNGALAGKFSVSQAAIGPNAQVPCAAHDSLLLTGTANI